MRLNAEWFKGLRIVRCPAMNGAGIGVFACDGCEHFKGRWYSGDEEDPGDVTAIDCAKAGVTP